MNNGKATLMKKLLTVILAIMLLFSFNPAASDTTTYERRILHSALQNHAGISTHSEGEEPKRNVVITLSKDGNGTVEDNAE